MLDGFYISSIYISSTNRWQRIANGADVIEELSHNLIPRFQEVMDLAEKYNKITYFNIDDPNCYFIAEGLSHQYHYWLSQELCLIWEEFKLHATVKRQVLLQAYQNGDLCWQSCWANVNIGTEIVSQLKKFSN